MLVHGHWKGRDTERRRGLWSLSRDSLWILVRSHQVLYPFWYPGTTVLMLVGIWKGQSWVLTPSLFNLLMFVGSGRIWWEPWCSPHKGVRYVRAVSSHYFKYCERPWVSRIYVQFSLSASFPSPGIPESPESLSPSLLVASPLGFRFNLVGEPIGHMSVLWLQGRL